MKNEFIAYLKEESVHVLPEGSVCALAILQELFVHEVHEISICACVILNKVFMQVKAWGKCLCMCYPQGSICTCVTKRKYLCMCYRKEAFVQMLPEGSIYTHELSEKYLCLCFLKVLCPY